MKKTRKSSKELRRGLMAFAATQGGYFTAAQAAREGYDRRRCAYHVGAGNFERAGFGLYRLATLPRSDRDELIRLSLWSRGRDDKPQAVFSHETALDLHGLTELIPSRTHMTVPRSFRKRTPKGVELHAGAVPHADRLRREGFELTTPLRTLVDIANGKSVSDEQLDKSVARALEMGLVSRRNLNATARQNPGLNRLFKALESKR